MVPNDTGFKIEYMEFFYLSWNRISQYKSERRLTNYGKSYFEIYLLHTG